MSLYLNWGRVSCSGPLQTWTEMFNAENISHNKTCSFGFAFLYTQLPFLSLEELRLACFYFKGHVRYLRSPKATGMLDSSWEEWILSSRDRHKTFWKTLGLSCLPAQGCFVPCLWQSRVYSSEERQCGPTTSSAQAQFTIDAFMVSELFLCNIPFSNLETKTKNLKWTGG